MYTNKCLLISDITKIINIRWLFSIFLLLLSNLVLKAQEIQVDSDFKDTIGMWADLALIEEKIGPLPDHIRKGIVAIEVQYYGFSEDGKADTTHLQQGVLVIHQSVKEDIKELFLELKALRFPIAKIIPVNKYGLNRDSTGWDDEKSMADNNTSAFNYRLITHSTDLSPHGLGNAIDFNPLLNPYEAYHHDGKQVEPNDAFYDQSRPGTVSDSVIVGLFDKRGWTWGGRWNNPVDFQHFDKRPGRGRKHYMMKESTVKDYFRYGDGDGTIAIYAEPYYKKQDQPEIFLYRNERDTFLHYMRWMKDEDCYQLFKAKAKQTWAEFKKSGNYFIDRFPKDQSLTLDFLERQGIQPSATFKKEANQPLKGFCIQLAIKASSDATAIDKLNSICADQLQALLEKAGATVIRYYLGIGSRFDPSAVYRYAAMNGAKLDFPIHLAIAIDFGNEEMYQNYSESDDFQVLYIPGAWKKWTMPSAIDRLNFLRGLISDDFPRSIELAKAIQYQIKSDLGLAPVSRQLPGPNLLETDCIKTDIDGIYTRYMEGLNDLQCPVVYVAAHSIYNSAAKVLLLDKKKGKEQAQKTANSIFEGILKYYGTKK